MDFTNRDTRPQAAAPAATSASGRRSGKDNKWGRIGVVAAVAAIVVLLLGITVLAAAGGDKQESKYVDNNKLQAVFLNTGQVYFGNIKSLNSKYFVLTNIYYLQTSNNGSSNSSSNANSNVTLVKLGCELHEPYDQMVINRDQVTFWENLQDNGQVATAVSTFKKQNPNGQKCADQSTSSSSNSSNSVQSAGSNNSSTTNTTNSTPKTNP
jgi:hypothetical protein